MAKGDKPYLRVGVVNGGCAGMEYVLDYAEAQRSSMNWLKTKASAFW